MISQKIERRQTQPRLLWALLPILLLLLAACATASTASPDQAAVDNADTSINVDEATATDLEPAPKVGHPAPEFTLVNLEGNPVSLSDYRGKPVILNFWATWCGPCRLEMPHLQDSYAAHQADDLVILAVNLTQDDDPDAIPPFIEEFGLTFPVILDEAGEMRQLYQLFGQPASVFIDRNGIITEYWQGPINQQFIEERLAKIL